MSGRNPDDIELLHQTYVSIDDANPTAAVQASKKGIVGAVTGSFPTFAFLDAVGLKAPQSLVDYLTGGGYDPAVLLKLIPDVFVERLCAAGTAEQVTETIRRMEASGIQHVLVAAIPSGGEGEVAQLRRFLDRVLPNLR